MVRSNILVIVLTLIFLSAPAVAREPVSYARDVRPILAAACFRCHGADEDAREGELRLDSQSLAHSLRGVSAAIVPGSAAKSLLFQRITADDESVRMPPADEPRQLTAGEITLLRRWIAEGGSYQAHWAFEKPGRPPLPHVQ
ncbi:MAG: c-type cytochrome domain-containing protein [Pirellulaceae bacterium]